MKSVVVSALIGVALSRNGCTAIAADDASFEYGNKVLEWIHNTEGGFFNPNQELRKVHPDDPNSSEIGIFAKEDIRKGEKLMTVPWSLFIKSKYESEEGQMCCGTVQAVLKEMELGNESEYYPYSEYLNQQDPYALPSAWSQAGKDLLYEIVGRPYGNDPRTVDFDCIPPEEPIEWYVLRNNTYYITVCIFPDILVVSN
jgi:hypothetical protein